MGQLTLDGRAAVKDELFLLQEEYGAIADLSDFARFVKRRGWLADHSLEDLIVEAYCSKIRRIFKNTKLEKMPRMIWTGEVWQQTRLVSKEQFFAAYSLLEVNARRTVAQLKLWHEYAMDRWGDAPAFPESVEAWLE